MEQPKIKCDTDARVEIEYKGNSFVRFPKAKEREKRVYYTAYIYTKDTKIHKALHREIWKDAFGEIPKGCVIHHKDGNSLNNKLSNLKCMSRGEHQSYHMQKPEAIVRAKEIMEKYTRPRAREWHKSKEGKKWHKEQAKTRRRPRKYIQQKKYKRFCIYCKKEYFTSLSIGTKYCSAKCNRRNNTKKKSKKSV